MQIICLELEERRIVEGTKNAKQLLRVRIDKKMSGRRDAEKLLRVGRDKKRRGKKDAENMLE